MKIDPQGDGPGERRVALIPETVKKPRRRRSRPSSKTGAGAASSFGRGVHGGGATIASSFEDWFEVRPILKIVRRTTRDLANEGGQRAGEPPVPSPAPSS